MYIDGLKGRVVLSWGKGGEVLFFILNSYSHLSFPFPFPIPFPFPFRACLVVVFHLVNLPSRLFPSFAFAFCFLTSTLTSLGLLAVWFLLVTVLLL